MGRGHLEQSYKTDKGFIGVRTTAMRPESKRNLDPLERSRAGNILGRAIDGTNVMICFEESIN